MPQNVDESGSDLQDDDDEQEEEESEQPVDEPEIASPAQREAHPVAESAVGVGKPVDAQGNPRVRKKKGKKGEPRGVGSLDEEDKRRPKEADLLWAWVMEDLAKKGIDPSFVTIRVARIDVGREVTVGYLQGDAVQGDDYQTPSDALVTAIIDNFHLTSSARGPLLYNVVFLVKGSINRSGQLKLPSPEEIINQRRHQQGGGQQWYPHGFGGQPNYPPAQQPRRREREEGPQGYGGPQGFGAPSRQQQQQQQYDPRYPNPQQPYDPRADRLERDMQDLKELVREVLTTGRAPAPVQQQPQGITLEMIASLKNALEPLGIKISAAAPGLGAPAAVIPGVVPKQNKESQEFEEGITKKIRSHMMHQTDKVLDAIFNPTPEKKPAEKEEEEEEEKPEADFEMVEVPGGVVWPGTTEPIRYARDLETGEVDYLKSAVFGNPHAMDKYGGKVIEIVGKLADGIKTGGVGLGARQQQPQQMREGLNGLQPAPQQQQSTQQQAPDQPASDGEDPFGL